MTDSPEPRFTPVPTRARHDGWTPDKQEAFIDALAETACVEEACRVVGMHVSGAYALRRRPDAAAFRRAWDGALDFGVKRLGDALIGRALSGTPVPHFYKGEQVGEHRRYDNQLAMWILRHRDPVNYGKWKDAFAYDRHPDGTAIDLALRTLAMREAAYHEEFREEERLAGGEPLASPPPPAEDLPR